MKIIITFIDHNLSEEFNGTEILEHKTIYSSTKILKDLEDQIVKNYFTYANILTDNIIRSIGNIYQILKTLEIISNTITNDIN